jgi:hypothetical protein
MSGMEEPRIAACERLLHIYPTDACALADTAHPGRRVRFTTIEGGHSETEAA